MRLRIFQEFNNFFECYLMLVGPSANNCRGLPVLVIFFLQIGDQGNDNYKFET